MQVWIHKDGKQEGPFDEAELRARDLRPDTPVWYEGLAAWTPASQAPLTAPLLSGRPPQTPPAAPGAGHNSPGAQPPCPPNYLGWAIISLVCCCLPFGIVAVVYASQVNSKWAGGDWEGALKASKSAQLWTILAIGLGIVFSVVWVCLEMWVVGSGLFSASWIESFL